LLVTFVYLPRFIATTETTSERFFKIAVLVILPVMVVQFLGCSESNGRAPFGAISTGVSLDRITTQLENRLIMVSKRETHSAVTGIKEDSRSSEAFGPGCD
jgi:hypothetical protein